MGSSSHWSEAKVAELQNKLDDLEDAYFDLLREHVKSEKALTFATHTIAFLTRV